MNIAIASDHRGLEAKRRLVPVIRSLGHTVRDLGCDGPAACDYPDFAAPAARMAASGEADLAILLDSSGIGMCVCANKVCGARAALVHDEVTARLSREANNCNVLCIGSDLLARDQIARVVETFINSEFNEGRHLRRVEKIRQLEQQFGTEPAVRHQVG